MTPISFVNSISRLVFGLRSFGGMPSFSGPKHMRIAFSLGQLIMPSFVALYWVMYLRAMFLSIGCLFAYPHSQYSFVRLPLFVSFTQLNHTKPGLAGNYLAIYRNLWAINFFFAVRLCPRLVLVFGEPPPPAPPLLLQGVVQLRISFRSAKRALCFGTCVFDSAAPKPLSINLPSNWKMCLFRVFITAISGFF